ncbi:MAG: DNA-processing protein DprA [Candidatus Cloacimonadaceae bacterium]|jgi:DNA processing protein
MQNQMKRNVIMQDAAYWISIAHMNERKDGQPSTWKREEINTLIDRIYHEQKSDLQEFFSLKAEDWRHIYGVEETQLEALTEAKLQATNNASLVENLFKQGFELIPIFSPDYSPTLLDNAGLQYAPTLLYIKGNKQLLQEKSIAIVGSRNASANGLKFTHNVAKQATEGFKVVVSGFAKGIDRAALDNALKYIGQSIIVLPQGVLTFSTGYRAYQHQIAEGDVLVLSTFHPNSPWSVGLAMARNPIIYALAQEIYVADSSNSGGTWAGVNDGLRKGRSIYIRYPETGEKNANKLLIEKGGIAVDINGERMESVAPQADGKELTIELEFTPPAEP